MRTIKSLSGTYQLTGPQFRVCSAMATMVSNIINAESSDEYKGAEIMSYHNQLNGLKWAAFLIDISENLIYDIAIRKHITGYKNYNRITETVYF